MRPSHRPGGAGLERTHVRHGDKWYIVSTIDRESSAALAPDLTYAETLVFEVVGGERGGIVHQDSAAEGSLRVHDEIVKKIRAGGIAALDKEGEEG